MAKHTKVQTLNAFTVSHGVRLSYPEVAWPFAAASKVESDNLTMTSSVSSTSCTVPVGFSEVIWTELMVAMVRIDRNLDDGSRYRLNEVPEKRRSPFNSKIEKSASNDTRAGPCLALLQYARVIRCFLHIEAGLQENIPCLRRNIQFRISLKYRKSCFVAWIATTSPWGAIISDADSGAASNSGGNGKLTS